MSEEKKTIISDVAGTVVRIGEYAFQVAYAQHAGAPEWELLEDLSLDLRDAIVPGTRVRRIQAYIDTVSGRYRAVWFELDRELDKDRNKIETEDQKIVRERYASLQSDLCAAKAKHKEGDKT